MSRLTVGALFGGASALLALGLLLMAGMSDAGATAPPGGSDIYATAVDFDGTGNSATSIGSIESQSANIAISADVCLDIIVDEVPTTGQVTGGTGIFGVGMNIHWDGTKAGLVGYRAGDKNVGTTASCSGNGGSDPDDFIYSAEPPFDDQSGDAGGAVFQSNSAPNPSGGTPNATGSFRIDNVWTDANETGPGRLAQFAFRCSATGSSAITLEDTDTGGGSKVGVLFADPAPGGTYVVANEFEGTLFCNTTPGQTPTPGATTAPPTTAPATTPATITPSPTPLPSGQTPQPTTPAPTTPTTITPTPTPLPSGQTPQPTTPAPTTPVPTTPTGQTVIAGDGDCDGEITTRDNQALLRKVLSQNPLSQTEPCPDFGTQAGDHLWGDWDCDGEISTRDNQALLRKVLSQNALSQTEPCPDIGTSFEI